MLESENRSSPVPNQDLNTDHQIQSNEMQNSGDNLLSTNEQQKRAFKPSEAEIMLDMPPRHFERQSKLTHTTQLIDL